METDSVLTGARKSGKGVDVFLAFCRMLALCTIISASLCLIAHGMAFFVGPPLFQDLTSLLEQSLRVYGMACSVITILVESEWQRFMAQVRLMDSWVPRSLFQIFLVILTVHSAVSEGNDDYHRSLHLYREISGICLLTCAGIYLCGGVLCLGYLKQSRMRRIVEQGKLEETLHQLEMQEKEIRKTLSRYSSV